MDFVQRKVNSLGRKVATFPHVETIGRTLFASSFFLSAWHEGLLETEVRTLGGLIFICGSFFGAFFLLLHQGIATTIHHDFYNQRIDTEEFGLLYIKFKRILKETIYEGAQNLYNSNFDEQHIKQTISKFRELADHAVTNPALFGRDEFFRRLLRFIKALAVVGALLFFVTMKHKLNNSKKESKVKTD
ncbi:unnamed protein product [Brassica napus]|uniref:(rape) hypothetical protein n=1 Tax=Brassica napus TaxID=3708 RepID=A0A816VYT3_BRANA|nr:unnamed protein product [Brassica napus]